MSGPTQTDHQPLRPGGIEVRVEENPPPVVAALRNDLAARLEDDAFAEKTRRVRGVVSLRDANTPQAATITIGDHGVELRHGFESGAEVRADLDLRGAGGAEIEGADEHPELAGWLRALLDAPAPEWPQAAARFWETLSSMAGAPDALRVVELESGEERWFGSRHGPAYEIHGPAEGLVEVFSGRLPVVDAAFAGKVLLRGTFPQLSVLTGAGFRVRYGPRAGRAAKAEDA